jgi:hypothetical protein
VNTSSSEYQLIEMGGVDNSDDYLVKTVVI